MIQQNKTNSPTFVGLFPIAHLKKYEMQYTALFNMYAITLLYRILNNPTEMSLEE